VPTGATTSQALHVAEHEEVQQTPSTQKLDAHSLGPTQEAPGSFWGVQVLLPPSQNSPDKQPPSFTQQTSGGSAVQGLATWKKDTVPGGVSSHSSEDVLPTWLGGSATVVGAADRYTV
jgi:hypothetical protein